MLVTVKARDAAGHVQAASASATVTALEFRPPVVGLVGRDLNQGKKTPDVLHACVSQFDIADVWTGTKAIPAGVSNVLSQLDWFHAQGWPVRLRFRMGQWSPAALMQGTKGVQWDVDDPGSPVLIRNWLHPQAASDYDAVCQFVASAFGAHPAVSEVCLANSMMDTVEVMLRAFSDPYNRSQAASIGWSEDADMQSLLDGCASHARWFTPLGIRTCVAINPYVTITASGGSQTDMSTTLGMIPKFRAVLGDAFVLMNCSLIPPTAYRGAPYKQMYDAFPSNKPCALQSATYDKLQAAGATPQQVFDCAAQVVGSYCVEVAKGMPITAAQAASAYTELAANAPT